ncbi:MAG: DNA-processing protein DprA [Patescibacteria group bacterium]|nr:DNA-processing protein DprA [Patescibacteria group bacterium]
MEGLKYWLALSQFYKFGPARFKKLKKYFPGMEAAFNAPLRELLLAGIDERTAEEFIIFKHQVEPNELLENLHKEKLKVLTIDDPSYPKLLKQIYDPPWLLYYRGQLEAFSDFALAVVGTRKVTVYGQQVTEKITKELVANNLTIVSGLALGIDTLAHLAAVDAGGRTIAVLGSGLDQQSIYPWQNRYLAAKIQDHGGIVISEYPPGAMPLKQNFPQRNRLISGLSLGTLVIEAGEKSGAVITAMHALDQNREVFAIPGNIYSPYSAGTNSLIKMGAKLIAGAKDIIESLNLADAVAYTESKKIIPDSAEEELILAGLNYEPVHVDELARLTKLNASVINSTLTIMEMKGQVKNLGGMKYVLAR